MSKKKRTGSNPLEDMFPQIQDTREQKEEETEDTKSSSEAANESSEAEIDERQEQDKQESSSAPESNGASTITIPKRKRTEEYVKMTYYFRPDQLKELDKLHKQSGRDKSELVRLAIDILIDQAKIE